LYTFQIFRRNFWRDSRGEEMPAAAVDFSAKAAVSLYQLLQKRVSGISLKQAENKKLDNDFEFYMEHYWREVYGDAGTLQGMKDLEDRPHDPDAFEHQHRTTKLDLKWEAVDTAQATASAEQLTKLLRDSDNDATAQKPTNSDYLAWMTFEVRYRCALESRPQKNAPRRGKSVKLTCAQIL
jgi:hypothetical protein